MSSILALRKCLFLAFPKKALVYLFLSFLSAVLLLPEGEALSQSTSYTQVSGQSSDSFFQGGGWKLDGSDYITASIWNDTIVGKTVKYWDSDSIYYSREGNSLLVSYRVGAVVYRPFDWNRAQSLGYYVNPVYLLADSNFSSPLALHATTGGIYYRNIRCDSGQVRSSVHQNVLFHLPTHSLLGSRTGFDLTIGNIPLTTDYDVSPPNYSSLAARDWYNNNRTRLMSVTDLILIEGRPWNNIEINTLDESIYKGHCNASNLRNARPIR